MDIKGKMPGMGKTPSQAVMWDANDRGAETVMGSLKLIRADCEEWMADQNPRCVDHIITDPPYGARTHANQRWGTPTEGYSDSWAKGRVKELEYDHLEPEDAARLGGKFTALARKWRLVMTSHDLLPAWEKGMQGYTFAPLPCVVKGMNIRMCGDGPSSWTIWMMVNRATGLRDGTKPGAYWVSAEPGPERANLPVRGAKPVQLMRQILRDYTQPGDVILDPFMGSGTTGIAAIQMGRKFIGIEKDGATFKAAKDRIEAETRQGDLIGHST